MNRGKLFLSGFRWILLLLFALLMEKAAEGITYRVGHEAIFSGPVVYGPILSHPANLVIALFLPHWQYLLGFLQFAITMLFAARYFVCLLDPIERFARIEAGTPSQLVREALATVAWPVLGFVTVVSVVEFVLLFHASTAFGSYHQWLVFLMLLVLWDTVAFLIIMPSLHRFLWFAVQIARVEKWLAKLSIESVRRLVGSHVNPYDAQVAQLEAALAHRETRLVQAEARVKSMTDRKKDLKEVLADYGPWNILDMFVLFVGLLGSYAHHSADGVVAGFADWVAFGAVFFLALWFLVRGLIQHPYYVWRIVVSTLLIGACAYGYLQLHLTLGPHQSVDACPLEVPLLLLVLLATVWYSYNNVKVGLPLWRRHIRVLCDLQ